MDNQRVKGVAQQIKGSVEKAVGKLTGNNKLETEGKIDKAAGSIRVAVGEANDVVKDAIKDGSK